MFHLFLHLLIPLIIALGFYKKNCLKPFLIMMMGMIVDIDHFLASPIYDPLRCSIGFHPLHTIYPIIGYLLLTVFNSTRLFGVGLITHMVLDSIDCRLSNGVWFYKKILDFS